MVDNLSELMKAGNKKLKQPLAPEAQGVSPGTGSLPRPSFDEMFPRERIEAIKKKELRRFKEAQDKKWDNWRKAVAEEEVHD